MIDRLIKPYQNKLMNLVVQDERIKELKQKSRDWLSLDLSARQQCDLELLVNGSLSPLQGYLKKNDFISVCKDSALIDGTMWPIPFALCVDENIAANIKINDKLALRDAEGLNIAVLTVEDIYQIENSVLDKLNLDDFACNEKNWYLGGRVEAIQLPEHYDFKSLRMTPAEIRNQFAKMGWEKILAFQTNDYIHRSDYEFSKNTAKELQANTLIQSIVGTEKSDDTDYYTRIRCNQLLMSHYPKRTAMLALLPYAGKIVKSRNIILQAIIAQNYGCTHIAVKSENGFSIENLKSCEDRLSIKILPYKKTIYVKDEDKFYPIETKADEKKGLYFSQQEIRERLADGRELPEWFTFSEIKNELVKTKPSRNKQGFTVFFTGLSGSGKSTLANALLVRLLELGGRPVTLLDGDIVRKNLSSELGFSKEHRDLNIRRIGFVASEITKNGGIALCAPIAPYKNVRKQVRDMISPLGGFILIHVSTPLEVCEKRDRKGLYAKARKGIIKEFTGISDPYEEPIDAEMIIDTSEISPEEAVQRIILFLEKKGFINGN